ncbi:ATP-binding cassette domain-containing protein, partial [Streptococcus gallolyticus]
MISVKNLKFTYLNSKKLSLKIDSLQVAKGECLVLCGKSGSGKTTFARLLNGLV